MIALEQKWSPFIITRDHLSESSGEAYSQCSELVELTPELEAKYPETFTLHDDDGELYFDGRALAGNDWPASEADPLILAYEWGMWYAGCTMVKQGGECVIG